MDIARSRKRIGRWSALLAAYAFVLNALLATSLLAATPAGKSLSGLELCATTVETASEFDHADKATKRAAIHCQLCLQHAVPAALAAPSTASFPLPLARTIALAPRRIDATPSERRFTSWQPRGPPHLN